VEQQCIALENSSLCWSSFWLEGDRPPLLRRSVNVDMPGGGRFAHRAELPAVASMALMTVGARLQFFFYYFGADNLM
jgi:hypothetical protein